MNPDNLFEARRAHLISLHTAGGWDLVARWTLEPQWQPIETAVSDLTDSRAALGNEPRQAAYDECVQHLIATSEHYAKKMAGAGMPEHWAIGATVHAMIVVAATTACTLARAAYGREPDPNRWRTETDLTFAAAVAGTARQPLPEPPKEPT